MADDLADGYIVLFGGQRSSASGNCTAGTEGWGVAYGDTWTLTNGSWTNLSNDVGSPPAPRYGAMLTYDPALGGLLLFGGVNGPTIGADESTCPSTVPPPTYYNDTWEFRGGRWIELHPATTPSARSSGQFAYDAIDAAAILFGGSVDAGFANPEQPTPLGDTWSYKNGTWTNATPLSGASPAARAFGSMAYDASDGSLILFGGLSSADIWSLETFNDTWEYRGGTWTQLTAGLLTSPSPRSYAEAGADEGGGVLLTGGNSGGAPDSVNGVPLNDTWEFRAGAWHYLTINFTVPGPGAVFTGAMALDPTANQMVLFGGNVTYPDCAFPWFFCATGASLSTWILTSPLPNGTSVPSFPRLTILGNITGAVPYSREIALSASGGTPPYSVLAWSEGGGGVPGNWAEEIQTPCWSYGESSATPGCLDPQASGSSSNSTDVVRNWSGAPEALGTVSYGTGGSTGLVEFVSDARGLGAVTSLNGWASGPLLLNIGYSVANDSSQGVGDVQGHAPLKFNVAGWAFGGLPPYVATFNFGDGNFSTDSPFDELASQWATHTYLTPGVYTVQAEVHDALGESFTTNITHVTVHAGTPASSGAAGPGLVAGADPLVATAVSSGGFAAAIAASYNRSKGRRRTLEARELVSALEGRAGMGDRPPPPP